jgi:anion-transporting  ArsA/GET3 family ATPase
MVLDRRLLIITGKGGVGRSAVAASLALRGAREGLRVLAASISDATGLAAHLGREGLHYEAAELESGLWGLDIHPVLALDEYLRLQLGLPRLGPVTRPLRALAETVPGIRDTVIIGKILNEVRRGAWDLVVVDGPPTGQIGSLLGAPDALLGLVGAGRIEEQARWMRDLLTDDATTGLVLVAIPEELPVLETLETLADLAASPTAPIASIILNRVLPDDVAPEDREAAPAGPAEDAAILHRGLVASQQSWCDRLPSGPRLPYLFGLQTSAEVASRLASCWEWP